MNKKTIILFLFGICFVFLPAVAFAENKMPVVSPIISELAPPATHFSVEATDPENDPLKFEWAGRVGCGKFTGESGPRATWEHPNDGPHGCPHSEGTSHPGDIAVLVTDGKGNEVRCKYTGSLSGVGPKCFTKRKMGSDDKIIIQPPKLISVDSCAKEKKAEAEARENSRKREATFQAIDALKNVLDKLRNASRLAEAEAKAAAQAAGGAWTAEATEDGKKVTREGWKKPGLFKRYARAADKAVAKGKDAAKKAIEAEKVFNATGGEATWLKARKANIEAFDAWQKALDALSRCLNAARSTTERKGAGGGSGPGDVSVSVGSGEPTTCREGDTRPVSSERKKVTLADLRSAEVKHEGNYGDYFDIDSFVEFLEYVQLGGKVIKQILAFHTGVITGALERVGMPDFLSYYETASDGMIEVIKKSGELKKRLQKGGDYWLRYPKSDYMAMCVMKEVCRKGKWKKESEFSLTREKGITWANTGRETVFQKDEEVMAAITKLFRQLEGKNRPALDEIEMLEKSCKN